MVRRAQLWWCLPICRHRLPLHRRHVRLWAAAAALVAEEGLPGVVVSIGAVAAIVVDLLAADIAARAAIVLLAAGAAAKLAIS